MKIGLYRSLLAVILCALTGCATVYSSKHIKKDLAKLAGQLNKQADGFNNVYNQRLAVVRAVQKAKMSGPLPTLNKELKTLKAANDYIQAARNEVTKQTGAVQQAWKGKKLLRKDDPGFPTVDGFVKYANGLTEDLPKKSEQFNEAGKRFDKILKENNIIVSDFQALQKTFDKNNATTKKSIADARSQLNKKKAASAQSTPSAQEYRRKTIERLSQILLAMERIQQDLAKVIADLATQYPQKGLVTITPNMPAARYVGDVQTSLKELHALAAEFNKLNATI